MKNFVVASLLMTALAYVAYAPLASARIPETVTNQPLALAQHLKLAQKEKTMSPSEAAKRAQQQYGGKVVGSPKCKNTDSGTVCTVKLDIDGRIKTVTIRG